MPQVIDAVPVEAIECVVIGLFAGEARAYYLNGLWYEPLDGPDALFADVITTWEPAPPTLSAA